LEKSKIISKEIINSVQNEEFIFKEIYLDEILKKIFFVGQKKFEDYYELKIFDLEN
jgi:hypothetical protein